MGHLLQIGSRYLKKKKNIYLQVQFRAERDENNKEINKEPDHIMKKYLATQLPGDWTDLACRNRSR